MEVMLDKLIMLLSTDWFCPYWPITGISLSESTASLIKEGCREIVPQILSGATNYYLAPFSEERMGETQRMLQSLTTRYGAEWACRATIEEWTSVSYEDENAGWLFAAVTEKLLVGRIPDNIPKLDHEIMAIVANCHEKQARMEVDFVGLSASSQSAWDTYVRMLTPDFPDSLADTLLVFLRARSFRSLWISVRDKLTPLQRGDLISWYRVAARLLGGREVAPSYLS